MSPSILFVTNVDGDPDPENTPPNNPLVLEKYRTMKQIVDDHAGGKGAFCLQTSPMYRRRFFEAPFVEFWRAWTAGGGELTLHPEEDLYCLPQDKHPTGTHYQDGERMRRVIEDAVATLAQLSLAFSAYKNGYHAQTPAIVDSFKAAGIGIDLSCAPGLYWPEKLTDWRKAPLSAFYMSKARLGEQASAEEADPVFQIPFGWDGQPSETPSRLLDTHYLVNEFSTHEAMAGVWDEIVRRAERQDRPQIVSLLCHTYTMADPIYRDRLKQTLDYFVHHGGEPVAPSEARARFDSWR